MHLLAAIVTTLVKSALILVGLMGLLFLGYLVVAEAGPTVREVMEAPGRLDELQTATLENVEAIAVRHGEATAHRARHTALTMRLDAEQARFEEELEADLRAIETAANEQMERVRSTVEENRRAVEESIRRAEAEACSTWNPLEWWACRAVRQRMRDFQQSSQRQRELLHDTSRHLQERARQDSEAHRQRAQERLELETAQWREELHGSVARLDEIERERQALEDQIAQLQAEEAILREANWLWMAFQRQWPQLLLVALLIFSAPFLRRTLWYFVGMPLVSRAEPIQLTDRHANGEVTWSEGARTLTVGVPQGGRLLARPGYIQSDRQGAKSEIFFDRTAPNLSYLSGLVLLTRLDSGDGEELREVNLGTPDDPDAYLMRIDLKGHPGVVLRASHVVALTGDIKIRSAWRLSSLHAWATSQVRFLIFSGTGSLILEGYGDVSGRAVDGLEEKRMHLVLGFDTRLTYQTRRTATFLPYLVDPGREPLVVDTFEGEGAVFFEKNPTARTRRRTAGEAIAGFFLDAIRRLLGL